MLVKLAMGTWCYWDTLFIQGTGRGCPRWICPIYKPQGHPLRTSRDPNRHCVSVDYGLRRVRWCTLLDQFWVPGVSVFHVRWQMKKRTIQAACNNMLLSTMTGQRGTAVSCAACRTKYGVSKRRLAFDSSGRLRCRKLSTQQWIVCAAECMLLSEWRWIHIMLTWRGPTSRQMPSVKWDHFSYRRNARTVLTWRGNTSRFDQVWSICRAVIVSSSLFVQLWTRNGCFLPNILIPIFPIGGVI
jgi:hypothetical protein